MQIKKICMSLESQWKHEFRKPMKNELKTPAWKKPVFETISNTGFFQGRFFNSFFIGFLNSSTWPE